jgi:hypothetical protein
MGINNISKHGRQGFPLSPGKRAQQFVLVVFQIDLGSVQANLHC